MKKSWSNVGDLQGQIPFSKLSYDLTGLDGNAITTPVGNGHRIEINVRGNLFVLTNRIVPSYFIANLGIEAYPTIRFNDMRSDPLDLTPYSIFELDYSKIYIECIDMKCNNNFPRDYSSDIVMLNSSVSNVKLDNFRRGGAWMIGYKTPAVYPNNTANKFEFFVPQNSENCKMGISLSITGGNVDIEFYGRSGSVSQILSSNTYGVADSPVLVDFSVNCQLYDTVYINVISDNTPFNGVLTYYFCQFA